MADDNGSDINIFDPYERTCSPSKKVEWVKTVPRDTECTYLAQREVSLCELLDRVLYKGVVLVGEVTISIADIDLIYLGLNLILSSAETLLSHLGRDGSNGKDGS